MENKSLCDAASLQGATMPQPATLLTVSLYKFWLGQMLHVDSGI